MKHITIFLTILIISACSKNNIKPEPQYLPDWTEVKVKSDNISFFDIYFLNDNFGLICGSSGTLLKTIDGGTTWQKMELGTDISFFRTSALDENTFAAGGKSLFATTDQGNSFSEITKPQDVKNISDIKFIDEQLWYVIGGNRVYKIIDAGTHWELIYNPTPYFLKGMLFTSAETCYTFGGETISDWIDGEIYSSGFLSKTTDSGGTWVEFQDSIITSAELMGISFINNNIGYFTNYFGEIYKTTNGGNNWTHVDSTGTWITNLLFINEHTGYYPKGKKLYKTTDGGANWEIDLDLDSLQLSFSKIINTENYLYLLNEDGSVFKKSNINILP
ncbi:hypothetical protein MNBD_BACTEROID01-585 [hydrothermal vent metagenome]|uniref:Photosynthesis system II assembly factor Ycf48/Hcf136-like domain-containing protein n=1 Tax=hydrothermal vent metagenome TaxID=652676 RepID=A0A3B0U5C1_9ZZZZ